MCGDSSTATQKGQADPQTGEWSEAETVAPEQDVEAQDPEDLLIFVDEAAEGVCARWLRSERLSSIILSSMCDLQGALANTGNYTPRSQPLWKPGKTCNVTCTSLRRKTQMVR